MSSQELITVAEKEREFGVATQDDVSSAVANGISDRVKYVANITELRALSLSDDQIVYLANDSSGGAGSYAVQSSAIPESLPDIIVLDDGKRAVLQPAANNVTSAITQAEADANTYADGVAATAESNANTYTDAQLTSFAAGAAGIFADTTSGLAGTSEGDYFNVPSTEPSEVYIVYRHDAGPVATEIGRTPSSSAVSALEERIPENSGSQVMLAISDSDGNVIASVDVDGGLNLLGMDETVQAASERIPETSTGGDAVAALQDSEGSALLSIDRQGGARLAGAERTLQNSIASSFIFRAMREASAGNDTQAAYWYDRAENEHVLPVRIDHTIALDQLDGSIQRVAAVTKAPDGRLLVVWQQIKSPVGSDGEGVRLVFSHVDYDLTTGEASSDPRTVLEEPPGWASNIGAAMHPHLITLQSGRILCVYNVNDAPSGLIADQIRNIYQIHSDDNGETWTGRKKIADAPGGAGTAALTGSSGDFVQIPAGTYAGRIVFSRYDSDGNKYAMYSDDDGVTWSASSAFTTPGYNSNESSIAWVPDSETLIMGLRTEGHYNEIYATSSDGGASWTFQGEKDSWQAGNCARSTVQASSAPADGYSKIIWTGLDNNINYARQDFVLRVSHDGGLTYQHEYVPWTRGRDAGYSNVKMIDVNTCAVVWENGFNSNNSIYLMIVNMTEVYRNGSSN